MGDGQKSVLHVGFEPRLRLAFQGAKIGSDAGLLVYRELDEAAKLTATAADDLFDSRIGRFSQCRRAAKWEMPVTTIPAPGKRLPMIPSSATGNEI